MPLDRDLMGIGLSDKEAERLGLPANLAVTAAGTSSTDATVLATQSKLVTMTATGSDGIRLPTNMPLNTLYFIYNSASSSGLIYPPTGGAINGGSTDAAFTITTKKPAWFMRLSTNVVIGSISA